jgi:hypothetical protein
MTEGEIRFYLREIHSHWATSNVSRDKLAALETAGLIEISTVPFLTVRLTGEGAQRKNLSRPPAPASGLALRGTVKKQPAKHRRKRPGKLPRAKPLV